MKFAKKVVVAVGMLDDNLKLLAPMRQMSFLSGCEVHFIHVFNTINYTTLIGDFPMVYPVEVDRNSIQESVVALLVKLSKEVLPTGFEGRVHHKCLFDESPKYKVSNYVKEIHADLVIIPTRQKHNFFDSSFAQYVNKHTSANMIFFKDRGAI
jgi:hypothetical protein